MIAMPLLDSLLSDMLSRSSIKLTFMALPISCAPISVILLIDMLNMASNL